MTWLQRNAGDRRFANGNDDPANTIVSLTSRGFTGEEMLAGVALVHLNGRVYDPFIGRMLSPGLEAWEAETIHKLGLDEFRPQNSATR